MSPAERRIAMDRIVECEMRCHGWTCDQVEELRAEVREWLKTDPTSADVYLAQESANAAAAMAALTARAS